MNNIVFRCLPHFFLLNVSKQFLSNPIYTACLTFVEKSLNAHDDIEQYKNTFSADPCMNAGLEAWHYMKGAVTSTSWSILSQAFLKPFLVWKISLDPVCISLISSISYSSPTSSTYLHNDRNIFSCSYVGHDELHQFHLLLSIHILRYIHHNHYNIICVSWFLHIWICICLMYQLHWYLESMIVNNISGLILRCVLLISILQHLCRIICRFVWFQRVFDVALRRVICQVYDRKCCNLTLKDVRVTKSLSL